MKKKGARMNLEQIDVNCVEGRTEHRVMESEQNGEEEEDENWHN